MADDHFNEYIGKPFIALSIVLTLVFFAVFTWLILPFVPAQTAFWQYAFSAYTAACLSGVFFLALYMFQLVLREYRVARQRQG